MSYISRRGVQSCPNSATQVVTPDKYILVLNGQSYNLEEVVANSDYGRYAAKGAPGLYIARHNDMGAGNGYSGSPDNVTGEYWLVQTIDGTIYRFGYDTDSEQVMANLGKQDEQCLTEDRDYTGSVPNVAVLRWLIDRVEDPSGNFMEYTYMDSPGYESNNCTSHGSGFICREIMEYLHTIEYNNATSGTPGNYASQISFSWVSGSNLCITGGCGNNNLTNTAGKYQLSSIDVLHNGLTKWEYSRAIA
ncbi:MAG: hypothetical protein IPJ90_00755 [Anaerolineaceae bacterium]|nr:hypothetical protein [Anaerolineaceae bacterium]